MTASSREMQVLQRLEKLHHRLHQLHFRIAKISQENGIDCPPLPPVPNGSDAATSKAKPATEDSVAMGENPLRPQPQPQNEVLEDLLGEDTAITQRVRAEMLRLGLQQCRLRRTPLDYYDWTLEERRAYLNAPSIGHLCKSMLMVNKRCINEDCSDRLNSKYYLVVFQFETRFNNEMMCRFVRQLSGNSVSRKKFNFRVASEEDNARLSGFEHNAVTPIGMAAPEVPIVMSQRIADTLDFIWLGGGEVNVKWAIGVREFIEAFNVIVGPIAQTED